MPARSKPQPRTSGPVRCAGSIASPGPSRAAGRTGRGRVLVRRASRSQARAQPRQAPSPRRWRLLPAGQRRGRSPPTIAILAGRDGWIDETQAMARPCGRRLPGTAGHSRERGIRAPTAGVSQGRTGVRTRLSPPACERSTTRQRGRGEPRGRAVDTPPERSHRPPIGRYPAPRTGHVRPSRPDRTETARIVQIRTTTSADANAATTNATTMVITSATTRPARPSALTRRRPTGGPTRRAAGQCPGCRRAACGSPYPKTPRQSIGRKGICRPRSHHSHRSRRSR
jgi:hypothetical protein